MTSPQRSEETQTRHTPGLKFCVWPKAFIHAAQTVVDRVFNAESLEQEYKSYIQSSDVQVTSIVKPTFSIAIHPGKLAWMLDNASVTVWGQRKDEYGDENFEKRVFGSIDVSINVIRCGPFHAPTYISNVNTANLSFSFSAHSSCINLPNIFNGQSSNSLSNSICNMLPSLSQADSRKRILEDVTIKAGSLICSNFGEPSTKRSRNDVSITSSGSGTYDDLGRTLISALANAVLKRLNHRLPDYLFPVGSGCDWMFSFGELSKPEFRNGNLESIHLAAIYYNESPVMLPIQTAPFPDPQNSSRMLTIFISTCVINKIGYCFHQHDILNYNLTQVDLIPQATEDNSTPDNTVRTRCLSDCFPEFSMKYPGASVEVNMASSEAPTATFSGQNLKVTLLGSAVFRARLADGSLVDILRTDVNVDTTAALKLNMGRVIGTVTSIFPRSITVVECSLESVNREVLNESFDLIATQFLRRKLEEITKKGIPLPCPLLSGVEKFENAEMWSVDDFLRIDTDLKFHA